MSEILIGKFDILSTYTYAKALLDGESENEAKRRRMGIAIKGAEFKADHAVVHCAEKTAPEKKKKPTMSAESFDHQVEKPSLDVGKRLLVFEGAQP